MASRSTDLNLYFKFSCKIKLLALDIKFLKTCKKNHVYPNFIFVKIPVNSPITKKVTNLAKMKWLDLEIKHLYYKRSSLEIEAYSLYKSLTYKLNELEFVKWCDFQRKLYRVIGAKIARKHAAQARKLKALLPSKPKTNPPKVETIIVNQSSQSFDNKEIDLLNKGLKFCPRPSRLMVDEVICSIESNIRSLNEASKTFIREACKHRIRQNVEEPSLLNKWNYKNQQSIVKRLRVKDCYYVKADKGNKVVILDKEDYHERVTNLINNGPYVKLTRNPLPKMVREVNNAFKNCNHLITPNLKRKLYVSNPVVPKLYCLPKIHKVGKTVRPIVSAIDAPTYKLSKFLAKEFTNLPVQQQGFSVKNSMEFINKIKDIELLEGEILISFDVSSLFPSVPIPITVTYLREMLDNNDLDKEVVDEYVQLTDLCMRQNRFQFNGEFFEQLEGTAMGNSLSPFMADLFMRKLETDLKSELHYFPRVWLRYVDDVFAIFDTTKSTIEDFLSKLNNKFPSIKFTYEMEREGNLPFLDTLVIRNKNRLEFDVYRKETSTNRYITNDSFHTYQHKIAAINFLVHRLLTFPLSKERFNIERQFIKNAAIGNGFEPAIVDKLICKIQHKIRIRNVSTFVQDDPEPKLFIVPFDPRLTRGLEGIVKDLGFKIIYKSNNSLASLLGNPKDKVGFEQKSGIYEINCKDCDKSYVGQTRRSLSIRLKEHLAHAKFGRWEKSSVAQHMFDCNHRIDGECLTLVKEIRNSFELDSRESLEIYKRNGKLINSDKGPVPYSGLFELSKIVR